MRAYGVKRQDCGRMLATGERCPCCPPKYADQHHGNKATRKRAKSRERRRAALYAAYDEAMRNPVFVAEMQELTR
jgi:hypothetical protein